MVSIFVQSFGSKAVTSPKACTKLCKPCKAYKCALLTNQRFVLQGFVLLTNQRFVRVLLLLCSQSEALYKLCTPCLQIFDLSCKALPCTSFVQALYKLFNPTNLSSYSHSLKFQKISNSDLFYTVLGYEINFTFAT